MTLFTIDRSFDARATAKRDWSGNIGKVTLEADVKKITVNGTELPADSVEYLLNFSLQSLQDAYAGAETMAEATANFDKKLAALIAGEIGTRGDGVSDETRIGLKLVRQRVGKDATDEYVKKVFEKNREKLAGEIKAEMARLAKIAADRKAAMAKVAALDLDI